MIESPETVTQKLDERLEQTNGANPIELRCLVCNSLVPGVVCGRKSPCPSCGFPYPLGDCSDLAEN